MIAISPVLRQEGGATSAYQHGAGDRRDSVMSNSLAGNPRPGGGPTRQQLDELDALLQRMLDLPVSGDDEPDEPPPAPVLAPPSPRASRTIPAPEPDLPPVR